MGKCGSDWVGWSNAGCNSHSNGLLVEGWGVEVSLSPRKGTPLLLVRKQSQVGAFSVRHINATDSFFMELLASHPTLGSLAPGAI